MRGTWSSSSMVCVAGGFGILLILLNVYLLYSVTSSRSASEIAPYYARRKIVWIYAESNGNLKHVVDLFSLAGYTAMTSLTPPDTWDVMWAYRFPFKTEFMDMLANLRPNQKVNHLPGTGYITVKNELATSQLRWVPPAFALPKDKDKFLLTVERNPSKLWVQKSNSHRGIKIIPWNDVNLDAEGTFVQEFITNPLLIDGKKFDIGVYVTFTSVNPLHVYIYEDEMLLRFCTEDYKPLDVGNVNKYVVGDDYIPWTDMPSLKSYHVQGRLSAKNAVFTYLNQSGYDTAQIWREICNCITKMFIAKEGAMDQDFDHYSHKENFFEMVRVDFILDDLGKVWLMEVNMSPNLSSDAHPGNALMYMSVIYGTLTLTGIASHIDNDMGYDIEDVLSSDLMIMIPLKQCRSEECLSACPSQCRLCSQCLSDVGKRTIKKVFREHHNRNGFRRLLPLPLNPRTGSALNASFALKGESNKLLAYWFEEKCKLDASWCQ